MWWPKWRFLAVGGVLLACGSAPPPAPPATPVQAPAPVVVALAPWPDVASRARAEKSGAGDVVVVAAVQPPAPSPGLTAVRVTGEDWLRFFPTVLGVPRAQLTALFDGDATRATVSSAIRAMSARAAPGGRLWFIALGQPILDEMEVAAAVARSDVQVVSVLDLVREHPPDPARFSRSATREGAISPILFSTGSAVSLQGGSRLALSYLLMGALRGWGDRDHDGRVTAAEAGTYLDRTLRLLTPAGGPRPSVGVSTDLACTELTTLSVAREPAPNLLSIVPPVPAAAASDPEPPGERADTDQQNATARLLYSRAEQEGDAHLARCTWSAVADLYRASWRKDPKSPSQVEAALNGADAYLRLGRTEEAAALYREYVREHHGKSAGETTDARARRAYLVSACSSYRAIAMADVRHFPGYSDTCKNVDCTGIDRATCAKLRDGAVVPRLGAVPGSTARTAQQQTTAARAREELAGWEATEAARASRLLEASEQYGVAERAWSDVFARNDAILDQAEAARGLAEAAVRRLIVRLAAGVDATEESVEKARALARRASDASADERRAEPARLLVELADAVLAREQVLFAHSQGKRGLTARSEARFEAEGDQRRVNREELPPPVAAAIAARDEYLARVPATFDASEARYRMAYEAGRLEFLYGRFAEARQRQRQILGFRAAACGWQTPALLLNLRGNIF